MALDVGKYGESTFWSDYQTALRNNNTSLANQYEGIISDPAQTQANQDFRQALIREGMLLNDHNGVLTPTQVEQYTSGVVNNSSLLSGEAGFDGALPPSDQAARLAWNTFKLNGSHGHIFDQSLPTDPSGAPISILQKALGGATTARAANISTASALTPVSGTIDVILAAIHAETRQV
jgi:hypothetical protein